MEPEPLLRQQVAYYRARAPEYDEWFLRKGRYDRGPEHRDAWFGEISTIEAVLRATLRQKNVLEFACGTGLWTRHLAENNRRVIAVDSSPEALAINRKRVGLGNVQYVAADIFSWVPSGPRFDAVVFAFWLSHVPPVWFDRFWATVRNALKPNGEAFFVDSLLEQTSTARDHGPLGESGIVRRRLNDGREFEIVKLFYRPGELERRLAEQGWQGSVRSSGRFFLYGSMTPAK